MPLAHPLPDPLVCVNGEKITDGEAWTTRRRPELLSLFTDIMYGDTPKVPPLSAKVTYENPHFLDGKATLQTIALQIPPLGTLSLLVATPHTRKPLPVFAGLNFNGNHTVTDDTHIPVPPTWRPSKAAGQKDPPEDPKPHGSEIGVWNVAKIVERGYALAVAYCGDIAIDRYDAPVYKEGYRAVSLWAWGMSRIADYLLSDSRFDPKRLAVIGHSRLGKAALLAGARDERFALVCPHQSGTGGAAPNRGNVGESVQRINTVFPHWFADRFKAYNADPERLPFDQNALIALVAPRSVLLTNAVDDQWANPDGQFEVLRGADSTYRMICGEGTLTATRPPVSSLSKGRLGYWIRPGDHRMNAEDWSAFLDYADACFHKKR